MRAVLVAALLLALSIAGCGGGGDERQEAIAGVVNERVVPAYADAVDSGTDLRQALAAFCANPTPSRRSQAQDRWRDAMAAWRRTEASGFGPVLRRRTLDYVNWPPDADRVRALIAGDTPLTSLGISSVASSARGLGGIEVVLFAPGDPAGTARGRRCDYLRATGGLIAQELAGANEGWIGTARPFAEVMTGGDVPDAESPQEAIDMMVSQHIELLEMMVDRQLALAATATDTADRRSLLNEGPASNAAADIANRLRGIRDAYAPIEAGTSLGDLLGDTGTRLVEQLDTAIATADGIDGPLSESDRLGALYEQVRDVKVLISTEVVSDLGVTVGFSDNDGDSG